MCLHRLLLVQARVGSVDVTIEANQALAEAEGIVGYPTLLVYKNGSRVAEYQGARTQR